MTVFSATMRLEKGKGLSRIDSHPVPGVKSKC